MLSAAGGAGSMAFGMTFVLVDRFSDIANNISNRLMRLDAQADRYNSRVSHNMQRSVNTIQSGIAQSFYGAALTLPFASAIEKAGEYQMSLIRIENLLGDAAKAQLFLSNIEKDALLFPAFGTQDLLAVSANILQVNGDVDLVRKSVKNLAMSMMQSGQTGAMAFQRMGLNLQQVFSRGILSFGEAKQWATAGLPIYKAFDELGIKYGEGIAVSAKDALRALERMAGSEKMLDKIANSAAGAGATLKELAEMTLVKFGLAIEKNFVGFAKALGSVLTNLRNFFETNIGKFVAKVIVLGTALISVGIIILGLFRIVKGFGNLFVSGFAYLFQKVSLKVFLGWLGRLYILLWLLPNLIKSNNAALQAMALIIAIINRSMGIITWTVFAFSRAWSDFTNFMEYGIKPTNKIGEAFVWLGGILQGLIAFFNTWDGENFAFSYKMDKALRDSGAMDFLLGMIWIIKSLVWAFQGIAYWAGVIAENKWVVAFAAGFYLLFKMLEAIIAIITFFDVAGVYSGLTARGVIVSVFSTLGSWIVAVLSFSWKVFSIFITHLAIGFWEVGVQLFNGITWALAGIRTAFMTTFVPVIVSGLTTIGTALGLAMAPLWVVALVVLAIILIIAGVIYLIYTYWEDIVGVLKIVGKYLLDFILLPLRAIEEIFQYLTGIEIGGSFNYNGENIDPLNTDYQNQGSSIDMTNFNDVRYGRRTMDNLGNYWGDPTEASYNGQQTIILQVDGKNLHEVILEQDRFYRARENRPS